MKTLVLFQLILAYFVGPNDIPDDVKASDYDAYHIGGYDGLWFGPY